MIISSKINRDELLYFRHTKKSLLFKLYQFAWQPRFGWARKYITKPAMKLFFFLKKNLFKQENFHIDVLYQGNWSPIQLKTTDLCTSKRRFTKHRIGITISTKQIITGEWHVF